MTDEQTLTDWLLEVTAIPTAAGREDRVIEWVHRWAEARSIEIDADAHGNLVLNPGAFERGAGAGADAPIVFVAHMDHPAFVVESIDDDAGRAACSFRGGVRESYFVGAALTLFASDGTTRRAFVESYTKQSPWGTADVRIEGALAGIEAGDIARWELPDPEVEQREQTRGLLRTHATDNLTSVVAALAALEALVHENPDERVAVLLTRAEEVGFVGAIGACRDATVPTDARVVVLENSRSFADAPLGGGVILRVGDRVSVFSPGLTAAIGKVAVGLTDDANTQGFCWQRKLMTGGACEATVFMQYGYETTCLCLPLENYHNMAGLDEVEAAQGAGGADAEAPRAVLARECVSLDDFFSMVELLKASATGIDNVPSLREKLEGYLDERGPMLGLNESVGSRSVGTAASRAR